MKRSRLPWLAGAMFLLATMFTLAFAQGVYKIEQPAKLYYWAQIGGDFFPNWHQKWDLGRSNLWWDSSFIRAGKFKYVQCDSGLTGAAASFWHVHRPDTAHYDGDTIYSFNGTSALDIYSKKDYGMQLYGNRADGWTGFNLVFDVTTGNYANFYGFSNTMSIASSATNAVIYGIIQSLSFKGSSDPSYGIYNYIHRLTGNGDTRGVHNQVESGDVSTGNMYGVYNELAPCGFGNHVGTYNFVNINNGTDTSAGTWNEVNDNDATNSKIFGSFNNVVGDAGDVGYGIYGKSTGCGTNYAGYFDGRVDIIGDCIGTIFYTGGGVNSFSGTALTIGTSVVSGKSIAGDSTKTTYIKNEATTCVLDSFKVKTVGGVPDTFYFFVGGVRFAAPEF